MLQILISLWLLRMIFLILAYFKGFSLCNVGGGSVQFEVPDEVFGSLLSSKFFRILCHFWH